jgi:UDP-N-acetylmuramyl pentapeptide phosphotransferase/UDP-N-acetylglucosamine-1-phosphate transferase
MHAFGVGTSHGLTRTHMTHHGPDLGGVTIILPIVFSALLHRAHTQVVVCPGTPKVESRNCPGFGLPGLWDIIASRPNLRSGRGLN